MNRNQHFGSMTRNINKVEQQRTSFSPLHEAAQKIAEYARTQSRYKAKELIGLLKSQGDRAARSAQPSVRIHIYIPHGRRAPAPVNLRLR